MSSDLELLYIFSYSCVNCIRSLGHIRQIYNRYHNHGLNLTLIHPPEWSFERSKKNVDDALKRLGINFPYKLDSYKRIIKNLNINFWPSCILLKDGKILYQVVGEGRYMEIERCIKKNLKVDKSSIYKRNPVHKNYQTFYLGKKKGGAIKNFRGKLQKEILYKQGIWKQTTQFSYNTEKDCSLMFRFNGNKLYLVVNSLSNKPSKMLIMIGDKFKKMLIIHKPGLYKISTIKFNKDVTITPIGRIAFYAISYI